MNVYEIIAASARIRQVFTDAWSEWMAEDHMRDQRLVVLAIVGCMVVAVLVMVFGHFFSVTRDKNRRYFDRGWQLAERGDTPEFTDDKREVRHVERGWKAGLTFLATKRQTEAAYRLKMAAVMKATEAQDISGALALIDEKSHQ